MRFEWDPNKNLSNFAKHGIDFEAATNLWLDEDRVEIWAPHPVEDRGIIIGKYQGKLWTAIFTQREDAIRIISVRRARRKEAKLYDKKKDGKKY